MVNRKILMTVLTLGMLAVVATAGTFAYFADQKTSLGNSITAGAMTLNNDIAAQHVSVTNAVPGDTGIAYPSPFAITNGATNANAAGTLTATISHSDENGDNANMWKDIQIYISTNGHGNQLLYDGHDSGKVYTVTIDSNLAAGATSQPVVSYNYLYNDNNVQTQGGVLNFDIQFDLKQNAGANAVHI